jgi:polar amino acid transport system substrate-binding protein
MLKRLLVLSLALLPLALAAPARAQPALVPPGKLTYGVAATFAPFEFQKGGQYVGFDVDFAAALASKMGLVPEILNMDFKGLIPALQGKRVDVINSAMYINAARAEQVDFIPYMRIGNYIVVRKGNPKGVAGRADLCGRSVAVTLGGIEETYGRQDVETCQKAGKPALTVLTVPTAQDSALALRQGRVDAIYDSSPTAAVLVTELPDVYQLTGDVFENNTQIGIAVRKGDDALKSAIQTAIAAVVKEGTYAKLMEKYRLPASGSIF